MNRRPCPNAPHLRQFDALGMPLLVFDVLEETSRECDKEGVPALSSRWSVEALVG